jgi:glycosyltransferase involved in cell wall biosynthesis
VDLDSFQVTSLPSQIQFLLIARLLGDKGIREYLKAASLVRLSYPEINFGLVGWLDNNPNAISKDELQYFIDSGDIKYYGRLNDVRPAIKESSIYVLPSYSEGTPRTVLEAMAMGRPIITTNAPGCKETVQDGLNGFLVSVKSVDELVEAMKKFIKNPDLIIEMGICSREIAEEKYDVIKVNNHMLKEMNII